MVELWWMTGSGGRLSEIDNVFRNFYFGNSLVFEVPKENVQRLRVQEVIHAKL